jgi:hypothetical protein
MNYFMSFAMCAGLTALGANESNAAQLLSCDINVAIFLTLAWYLGRRKKA